MTLSRERFLKQDMKSINHKWKTGQFHLILNTKLFPLKSKKTSHKLGCNICNIYISQRIGIPDKELLQINKGEKIQEEKVNAFYRRVNTNS